MQMGGYSFRMCRLWVCLLVTETVAIAAAARSPEYWLLERVQTWVEFGHKSSNDRAKSSASRKVAGSNHSASKIFQHESLIGNFNV